jgi:AcrR family transcriptional regulator
MIQRGASLGEVKSRTRRSADEARQAILEAAEKRLIEHGPGAIKVQTIARDLGLTDAAVHYHFGSQDGLVDALIRFGGARLKDAVHQAVASWTGDTVDVPRLVGLIRDTYGDRGYARLAAWMALAGWKSRSGGMYGELVERVHAARVHRARQMRLVEPAREDTQHLVVLLNLVLFADGISGSAFRRSVGLRADAAAGQRFREWFTELLELYLQPPEARARR